MSTIYLTSDWHISHNKSFIYEARGFNSIEEHDKAIFDNLKKTLQPGDILYNLGDVCFARTNEIKTYWLEKIKGLLIEKHLLIGNHDYNNLLNKFKNGRVFDSVKVGDYLKHSGHIYMLSHYPMAIDPSSNGGRMVSVHGHTHSKEKVDQFGRINVAVDAWNMKPVPLSEVIGLHTNFRNNYKKEHNCNEY